MYSVDFSRLICKPEWTANSSKTFNAPSIDFLLPSTNTMRSSAKQRCVSFICFHFGWKPNLLSFAALSNLRLAHSCKWQKGRGLESSPVWVLFRYCNNLQVLHSLAPRKKLYHHIFVYNSQTVLEFLELSACLERNPTDRIKSFGYVNLHCTTRGTV